MCNNYSLFDNFIERVSFANLLIILNYISSILDLER